MYLKWQRWTLQICCFKWNVKCVMIIKSNPTMLMMRTSHVRSSDPRQSSRGGGVVARESVCQCQVLLHKTLCTYEHIWHIAICTLHKYIVHWTRCTVMTTTQNLVPQTTSQLQWGPLLNLNSAPNTLFLKKSSVEKNLLNALFSFNCAKTITQGSQTKSWRKGPAGIRGQMYQDHNLCAVFILFLEHSR